MNDLRKESLVMSGTHHSTGYFILNFSRDGRGRMESHQSGNCNQTSDQTQIVFMIIMEAKPILNNLEWKAKQA